MYYLIGLDLGGTTISAGVVDMQGKIKGNIQELLKTRKVEDVLEQLANIVVKVCSVAGVNITKEVFSIGLGSPGLIDSKQGIIMKASNFPDWKDVRLASELARRVKKPVYLENDALCATAAEYWIGVGKMSKTDGKSFFMYTIGTGVGGGAVVDGKLLGGFIEPGHMIVESNGRPCGCGQSGCLESYASATAVLKRARELSTKDYSSCKDVFDAARKGDNIALQAVQECIQYLALGCIIISRVVDPGVIALAGGMLKAGPFFMDKLHEELELQNWSLSKPVKVMAATAGNNAGWIGSAYVALTRSKSSRSNL